MVTEPSEELTQESGESLEHFVQRVLEKWEKQGGIVVNGEVLAEVKHEAAPEGRSQRVSSHSGKGGAYVVNNVYRHRKLFSPNTYFAIDNWWYDFRIKNLRVPTFVEMQQMCARRGIAGRVGGKPATFPDNSMRAIYRRLLSTPDPIIRKCLGHSGHCAPLHHYKTQRIFYMSAEADRAVKRSVEKALEEKGVLAAMHKK